MRIQLWLYFLTGVLPIYGVADTDHDGSVETAPTYLHARVEDLAELNQELVHRFDDPKAMASEHSEAIGTLLKRSRINGQTLFVAVKSLVQKPNLKEYVGGPDKIASLASTLCANPKFPEVAVALVKDDANLNFENLLSALPPQAQCQVKMRPGLEEALIKGILTGDSYMARTLSKLAGHLKPPENSKVLIESLSRAAKVKPQPPASNVAILLEALAKGGVPSSETAAVVDALRALLQRGDPQQLYAALGVVRAMGSRASALAPDLVHVAENAPELARDILPLVGEISSAEVFGKFAHELLAEGDDSMAIAGVQSLLNAYAKRPNSGPELDKLLAEVRRVKAEGDARLNAKTLEELENRTTDAIARRVVGEGYTPAAKDSRLREKVSAVVEATYNADPKAPDLSKISSQALRQAFALMPDERVSKLVDTMIDGLKREDGLGRSARMLAGAGPRARKAYETLKDSLIHPDQEKVGAGFDSVYAGYSLADALRSIGTPEQLKKLTPEVLQGLSSQNPLRLTYAIQFAGKLGKQIDEDSYGKLTSIMMNAQRSFGMDPISESTIIALQELKQAGHQMSAPQVQRLGQTLQSLIAKPQLSKGEKKQLYNAMGLVPLVGGDLSSLAPKLAPVLDRSDLEWPDMAQAARAMVTLRGESKEDVDHALQRVSKARSPQALIALSHFLTEYPSLAQSWVRPLHEALLKGGVPKPWQRGVSLSQDAPPAVSATVFQDVISRLEKAPDVHTAHEVMERLLPHPHLAASTQVPMALVERLRGISAKYRGEKGYEARELASWPERYIARFKQELERESSSGDSTQ